MFARYLQYLDGSNFFYPAIINLKSVKKSFIVFNEHAILQTVGIAENPGLLLGTTKDFIDSSIEFKFNFHDCKISRNCCHCGMSNVRCIVLEMWTFLAVWSILARTNLVFKAEIRISTVIEIEGIWRIDSDNELQAENFLGEIC